MDPSQKRAWFESLSDDEAQSLYRNWVGFLARPDQLPANDDAWDIWLVIAGRGFGKTRLGAEWIKEGVERGECKRVALVGRTAADVRDVMVEGESGLLSLYEIGDPDAPIYQPSKRRLIWPKLNAIATCYSADEPNLLRGPQHDRAWADEIAAWKYFEAWDNLLLGLRLGAKPRCVATTTPKPLRVIRDLLKDPTTHVTRGSTYDNVHNLAASFQARIIRKYEGTTLGRQELYAEVMDEAPGALWKRKTIDDHRREHMPDLVRIVVGVDPATTSKDGSCETGIVAAGADENGHFFVLDDVSGILTPDSWAQRTVGVYHGRKADRVVAEVNNGGDLVESNIRHRDTNVSYSGVHASKGKYTRAEPIAALYEQGRVHHVGMFSDLEDQLVNYVPGVSERSPDRMDALVWALTELSEGAGGSVGALDSSAESVWKY